MYWKTETRLTNFREAWHANLYYDLLKALKESILDRSEFSAQRALISASVVPAVRGRALMGVQ